jgi:hypothetical protein
MSQDELTPIWRNRMRVLFAKQDILVAKVDGIALEMQWVRSRLAPDTSPTQSLPRFLSSPTGSPSKIPSPSWPKRLFRLGLAKLTGEALSAALMWLGTRFLTWALYAILGLPALAWLARWLRLFGLG